MPYEYYTYFHTRNDSGEVFYVGKGRRGTYRESDTTDRNPYWKNIYKKCGRTTHIAARWKTEQEAFDHEKFLILCFKDIGIELSNMTDGGEGVSGLVFPESGKQKLRDKMSPEWKERIATANRGKVRTEEHKRIIGDANRGKFMSAETRAAISDAVRARRALEKESGIKRVRNKINKDL